MVINVSLDTANINTINISTLDLRIWQHFSRHWTQPHLQKLTVVSKVPVTQFYRDRSTSVNQFTHLSSRMMMRTHPSYGQS